MLSPEKVQAAAKAGLAAAATKAKLFADHEEREIQRLSANIINHQVRLSLVLLFDFLNSTSFSETIVPFLTVKVIDNLLLEIYLFKIFLWLKSYQVFDNLVFGMNIIFFSHISKNLLSWRVQFSFLWHVRRTPSKDFI